MRKITGHEVNAANEGIEILATDEKGPGGANHEYQINIGPKDREGAASYVQFVSFQNGPVKVDGNGLNGTTHEALLTIVADRLQAFQNGPYACDENQKALDHVLAARSALLQRTFARMARGVEGTHEV